MRPGRRSRCRDLDRVRARPPVRDVLSDGRREQERLLQHNGELITQVGYAVLAQVDSVEQDRARCRVVEPREEIHERRLARPGGSRYRNPRARWKIERDVAQHRSSPFTVIGEGDLTERDRAPRARQGPGVDALGYVEWLVQQREDPFRAGKIGLDPCGLPADRLERIVQLAQVPQHHQQLAQGERARLNVLDADEQHGGRTRRSRQADQHAEAAFH